MTIRYTNLPNNRHRPFGEAHSVHDDELCSYRDTIINNFSINDYYKKENSEEVKNEYFSVYKKWMFSTFPKIKGYEDFNEACFTQGTTESFYQFYIRYRSHRRLRLAKGEYFFHQMMSRLWYPEGKFAWIEDEPITKDDVVLISVPFSDTGCVPEYLEDMLCECDKLDVPVMIDLAYLNLAVDLEFDLSHPCIKYIVSSLSKVFPIELHRVGIRLQREKWEDQLYVINEPYYNYINILSCHLGLEMMKKFSADYTYNKYREKQIALCEAMELQVSDCVYFGIDHNNQYPQYNRGNDTNRLCFSRIWDGRMKLDV